MRRRAAGGRNRPRGSCRRTDQNKTPGRHRPNASAQKLLRLGRRGIVAGRFHADPQTESIAVFGYSKKVQLLTRERGSWRVETIFEDVDKGHWLAVGELDGRNATDEIILSGYGARVVLLARPPGYGLAPSTATDR